jgi:antitoxin (DNA-binding transcriptional repressor) of toxin-antitoxin stability system
LVWTKFYDDLVIKATIHHVKTHLSRLLREVQKGETVIILHGDTPVARLTAIKPTRASRPRVGTPTTTGVRWTKTAFEPLNDEELAEWGL